MFRSRSVLDGLHRLAEVDVGLALHAGALHHLAQAWVLEERLTLFLEVNSIATTTSFGSSAVR